MIATPNNASFHASAPAVRRRRGNSAAAAKAAPFREYAQTLTEEQVRAETARCLGCGASVVDPNKCIGCGLCTTKCAFDAINLTRERPECSDMVKYEKKVPSLAKYALKREIKIRFGKKK